MMVNPGLPKERPDMAALLAERGDDGAQPAATDRTLAGLDAISDLGLKHRLAQGTLCGVGGGLDSLDLQEGLQAMGHLEQRLAGAHRPGPNIRSPRW
jgi:hypothetical protein